MTISMSEARRCSSCNAIIFWTVTAAKKRMPLNEDGTSHFATCPDAAKHRKPRPKKGEQLDLLGRGR